MSVRRREESGATLVLVLAFLVLIGVVGSAMLSSVSSGLGSRVSLDAARNREYAADGAIEHAIAEVRNRMTTSGSALFPCANPLQTTTLNQVTVQVDCTPAPAITISGYWQRNFVFTACPAGPSPCSNTSAIIRAHVNFESPSGIGQQNIDVTGTTIQSWNVLQ